ncbi:MAG TPA: hypothetical protein VGB55_11325, partial [Tepidisphaeraceae bacterium]
MFLLVEKKRKNQSFSVPSILLSRFLHKLRNGRYLDPKKASASALQTAPLNALSPLFSKVLGFTTKPQSHKGGNAHSSF